MNTRLIDPVKKNVQIEAAELKVIKEIANKRRWTESSTIRYLVYLGLEEFIKLKEN